MDEPRAEGRVDEKACNMEETLIHTMQSSEGAQECRSCLIGNSNNYRSIRDWRRIRKSRRLDKARTITHLYFSHKSSSNVSNHVQKKRKNMRGRADPQRVFFYFSEASCNANYRNYNALGACSGIYVSCFQRKYTRLQTSHIYIGISPDANGGCENLFN